MDDIWLWKWAGSLYYENIIFIIKCLVGARLIFVLQENTVRIAGKWEGEKFIGLIPYVSLKLSGK